MTESLAELKTTQEEQADLVRRYVDEYAALALEADRIKQRMDWLKGQFETLATGALKDTKLLSISYWGSQNSRVTVTNTATVKPISLTMVKKVLGNVAGDFVKSETVDKMTEPCKRLLAMVCQGNFTEGSLEETVRAITGDGKIQATLRKKLKGRYEKDKALLEKVAGLLLPVCALRMSEMIVSAVGTACGTIRCAKSTEGRSMRISGSGTMSFSMRRWRICGISPI